MTFTSARRQVVITLAFALALGVACSSEIDASDYEQSCARDDDCVAIFIGDTCDCACDHAAINRRDKARYEDDRPSCGGCGSKLCGPCPGVTASCSGGRCIASPETPNPNPIEADAATDGSSDR